jgi:hypothetical protein
MPRIRSMVIGPGHGCLFDGFENLDIAFHVAREPMASERFADIVDQSECRCIIVQLINDVALILHRPIERRALFGCQWHHDSRMTRMAVSSRIATRMHISASFGFPAI